MTHQCEQCRAAKAHPFHQWRFGVAGELATETASWLCTACARARRKQFQTHAATGATRDELIAQLDQFFAASGVFDICRRCHEQGTGCCPPTCRIIKANGCESGKTLYCATFLCSALLHAISECDPETGRLLKWLKTQVGVTEWRVYEMFTRVPAAHRDPARPLALPERYPLLPALDGAALRSGLQTLAEEVLALRLAQQKEDRLEQPEPSA